MATAWGPEIATTVVALTDTLSTSDETLVAVVDASGSSEITNKVVLSALVSVGVGADTSELLVKIRKGNDVTGDTIATWQGTIPGEDELGTAAAAGFDDLGGPVSFQQYALTVQAVAASADGSIGPVVFTATVY